VAVLLALAPGDVFARASAAQADSIINPDGGGAHSSSEIYPSSDTVEPRLDGFVGVTPSRLLDARDGTGCLLRVRWVLVGRWMCR
jgi:hypothetical protein